MSKEYILELKNVPVEVVKEITNKLKEGASLILEMKEGKFSFAHMDFIKSFSSFIDELDPKGDYYSRSLKSDWKDAEWLHGNSPKTLNERLIVMGQYLAIIHTIQSGRVRVVKESREEAKGLMSYSSCFHKRNLPIQNNLVFVLMPFIETWSDYIWKKEIKPIVENIENYNLVVKRADDLFGPDVMQDIYDSILTASIIIADLSGRNANVFYELGIAHTLGKDVILLSQGVDNIPFDLNRFRICLYTNDGPGYEVLRSFIPRTIVEILKSR